MAELKIICVDELYRDLSDLATLTGQKVGDLVVKIMAEYATEHQQELDTYRELLQKFRPIAQSEETEMRFWGAEPETNMKLKLKCSECGRPITEHAAKVSKRRLGREMCYGCGTRAAQEITCTQCGASIGKRVAQVSRQLFGRQLCFDCQMKIRTENNMETAPF